MGKYSPKERCKPARRRTEAYSSLNCVLANRRVLSFVFKAVGIACFVYWKNRDFGPLKTHPGNPITQEYTKFYCQLFDVWIVKIQILTHFIAATFSRKQFILPFSIHLNPHWNTPSSPHCASTTSAKVMAVFASFTSTGRKSVFPGTCICAEENGSIDGSVEATNHSHEVGHCFQIAVFPLNWKVFARCRGHRSDRSPSKANLNTQASTPISWLPNSNTVCVICYIWIMYFLALRKRWISETFTENYPGDLGHRVCRTEYVTREA